MRTKEMTVYERITSFYSAPFTKFMGNLVNVVILEITDVSLNGEQGWRSPSINVAWVQFLV